MKVIVTWSETTTYEQEFELDVPEVFDWDDGGEVLEIMEAQDAFDQVTKEGWLGESLMFVSDRRVTEAKQL